MPLFQKTAPKGASSHKIAVMIEAAKAEERKVRRALEVAVSASLEKGGDWTADVAAAETKRDKIRANLALLETGHAEALKREAKQAADQAQARRDAEDKGTLDTFRHLATVAKDGEAIVAAYVQWSRTFGVAHDAVRNAVGQNPRVPNGRLPTGLTAVSGEISRHHQPGFADAPGVSRNIVTSGAFLTLDPIGKQYADWLALVTADLRAAKGTDDLSDVLA